MLVAQGRRDLLVYQRSMPALPRLMYNNGTVNVFFWNYIIYIHHDRRKFRSQTSDNMDRWKAEQGRGREKRKIRREKSRRERVRRKKIQMREKVGKSRFTVFLQWFVAPGGRKVGSLKRRVRSQLARWEMKNCTPLWREAHFQVKMYKTHHSRTTSGSWDVEKVHAVVARSTFWSQNVQNTPHHSRTTFGSWDVEKVHAVVARSTFWSQNVQNTPFSDHFWKLRCRKSARRCGAKHILKSKCTKHTRFGPLLEVEMSKKCTPLWHEAHFQVKMCKTHIRATFGGSDVEKVHAVVARSTFQSQNVQNTRGSDHFWRFRCRFASLRVTTLHYTLHYTTVHYTTLRSTTLQLQLQNYTTTPHYTPLHYTTLHYTTLHSTTLHYTTLHSTPLHYTTLHYTIHSTTLLYTLHYTTVHYTTLHSTTLQLQLQNYTTTLHYTPLHSTTLNYTTLHYTTLHSTTLHYITLHYTTFHYTSLHDTPLHSTTLQLQLRLHNYTPLHSTTRNYITLHNSTLHYTTFHFTPLHYTTLHYTTLHWMTLHHR